MKLYSLQYTWYWHSYHVVANSREEALKIIKLNNIFISDTSDDDLFIFDSWEDANDSDKFWHYWTERDIGKVLVTDLY